MVYNVLCYTDNINETVTLFFIDSAITLLPTEVASACLGERLDVECSTNQDFIQWYLTVIDQETGEACSRRARLVSGVSPIQLLTVNGIPFTIARNSSPESHQLISILSITNVTAELNGTQVNCSAYNSMEDPSIKVTTLVIPNISKLYEILNDM